MLELSPGFCPGVQLLFQCGWPKALPGLSLGCSRGATTPSWHASEKVTAPGHRRVALAPAFPSVDQFSSSVFCFQGKFLAFYQYAKSFNSDDFDYAELKDGDYVFMRWKVSRRGSSDSRLRVLCCVQFVFLAESPHTPTGQAQLRAHRFPADTQTLSLWFNFLVLAHEFVPGAGTLHTLCVFSHPRIPVPHPAA